MAKQNKGNKSDSQTKSDSKAAAEDLAAMKGDPEGVQGDLKPKEEPTGAEDLRSFAVVNSPGAGTPGGTVSNLRSGALSLGERVEPAEQLGLMPSGTAQLHGGKNSSVADNRLIEREAVEIDEVGAVAYRYVVETPPGPTSGEDYHMIRDVDKDRIFYNNNSNDETSVLNNITDHVVIESVRSKKALASRTILRETPGTEVPLSEYWPTRTARPVNLRVPLHANYADSAMSHQFSDNCIGIVNPPQPDEQFIVMGLDVTIATSSGTVTERYYSGDTFYACSGLEHGNGNRDTTNLFGNATTQVRKGQIVDMRFVTVEVPNPTITEGWNSQHDMYARAELNRGIKAMMDARDKSLKDYAESLTGRYNPFPFQTEQPAEALRVLNEAEVFEGNFVFLALRALAQSYAEMKRDNQLYGSSEKARGSMAAKYLLGPRSPDFITGGSTRSPTEGGLEYSSDINRLNELAQVTVGAGRFVLDNDSKPKYGNSFAQFLLQPKGVFECWRSANTNMDRAGFHADEIFVKMVQDLFCKAQVNAGVNHISFDDFNFIVPFDPNKLFIWSAQDQVMYTPYCFNDRISTGENLSMQSAAPFFTALMKTLSDRHTKDIIETKSGYTNVNQYGTGTTEIRLTADFNSRYIGYTNMLIAEAVGRTPHFRDQLGYLRRDLIDNFDLDLFSLDPTIVPINMDDVLAHSNFTTISAGWQEVDPTDYAVFSIVNPERLQASVFSSEAGGVGSIGKASVGALITQDFQSYGSYGFDGVQFVPGKGINHDYTHRFEPTVAWPIARPGQRQPRGISDVFALGPDGYRKTRDVPDNGYAFNGFIKHGTEENVTIDVLPVKSPAAPDWELGRHSMVVTAKASMRSLTDPLNAGIYPVFRISLRATDLLGQLRWTNRCMPMRYDACAPEMFIYNSGVSVQGDIPGFCARQFTSEDDYNPYLLNIHAATRFTYGATGVTGDITFEKGPLEGIALNVIRNHDSGISRAAMTSIRNLSSMLSASQQLFYNHWDRDYLALLGLQRGLCFNDIANTSPGLTLRIDGFHPSGADLNVEIDRDISRVRMQQMIDSPYFCLEGVASRYIDIEGTNGFVGTLGEVYDELDVVSGIAGYIELDYTKAVHKIYNQNKDERDDITVCTHYKANNLLFN